jgi:micrococcal nuclease
MIIIHPLKMILIGIILLLTTIHAEQWNALVTRVVDGDTYIVQLESGKKERVRIFGIDTPEYDQPYGDSATIWVTQRILDQQVTLSTKNRDRWNRIIAEVHLSDGKNLAEELVSRGLAWWWPQYAPEEESLKNYQARAQKEKIGLWSAPSPKAPWKHRQEMYAEKERKKKK